MFTKPLLCAGLQAGVEPNEAPVLEELPVKKSFQKDRAGGCSVLLGLSLMGGVLGEPGWGRTTGNASFLPSFFLSSSSSPPPTRDIRNPTSQRPGSRGLRLALPSLAGDLGKASSLWELFEDSDGFPEPHLPIHLPQGWAPAENGSAR